MYQYQVPSKTFCGTEFLALLKQGSNQIAKFHSRSCELLSPASGYLFGFSRADTPVLMELVKIGQKYCAGWSLIGRIKVKSVNLGKYLGWLWSKLLLVS